MSDRQSADAASSLLFSTAVAMGSKAEDEFFAKVSSEGIVKDFVRRYGRFFTPQQLPKQFRRGGVKLCFANSYRMAIDHSLTYVEGFAVSQLISDYATLHAWCVDARGNVLDRTWGLGVAYFGIPFQTDYLQSVIGERKKTLGKQAPYGLLDDWQNNWPLIRLHGDTPEKWYVN